MFGMKIWLITFSLFLMHSLSTPLHADSLFESVVSGDVDGEVRSVLYMRSAGGRSDDGISYLAKASGLAVGGHIGYTTKPFHHITARLAGYTTQALSGDGNTLAKSNLVNGEEDYTILGEAYFQYDDSINKLKIGRQGMQTPLVYSDDARVIKDLFSGVTLSSKLLDNHTFHLFYLDRMSGMDNGHEKKQWVSMSEVLGASYERGMTAVGVQNSSFENLNTQLWYYDVPDTIKMIFTDVKYKNKVSENLSLTYEAHYWKSRSKSAYENDTSSIIDYYFAGARISAEIDKFTLQLAYDHMGKEAGTKTIHEYYGNFAEYTYGFLLGSGAYGAELAPINPNNMTSMDALKATVQYHYNKDTHLYSGYMMATSDDKNYQSDVNILDIALFMSNVGHKDVSLALIYENWDSDGNNFFIDNNLLRTTVKFKF
ncbi:MAG: outer membrane porin, OprD family [Methylophaga sp.]|nr:outer membrane porin, OprD family [Methylophaga sp.]